MRIPSVRLFVVAGVAALALAACGSSSKSSEASSTTVAPTPTTVAAPTTTGGTSAGQTVALASVKVGDEAKMILVDDKGMTLYIWDKDTTAGKASCTGACATAWPPLYVTGTPSYGTGLTETMFSEVTGPNGSKQLAINGKPLYHWVNDKKAGDATGQDVNDFYVVSATGQKVDES